MKTVVPILCVFFSQVFLTNCIDKCDEPKTTFQPQPGNNRSDSLVWGKLKTLTQTSLRNCVRECFEFYDQCVAFATNSANKSCVLLQAYVNESGSAWVNVSGEWNLYRKGNETTLEMPVFRVTASSGVLAIPAWLSGKSSDLSLEETSRALDLNTSLKKSYYKHPLVNDWENWDILQVYLKLFDHQNEVIRLQFRGSRTSYKSWFSKSTLLSSPWQDLANSATNAFAIPYFSRVQRGFFINKHYGGCDVDTGWLVVLDKGKMYHCGWAKPPVSPLIQYSEKTTCQKWKSGKIGHATDMIISVVIRV